MKVIRRELDSGIKDRDLILAAMATAAIDKVIVKFSTEDKFGTEEPNGEFKDPIDNIEAEGRTIPTTNRDAIELFCVGYLEEEYCLVCGLSGDFIFDSTRKTIQLNLTEVTYTRSEEHTTTEL
jgi:hypothetical protein